MSVSHISENTLFSRLQLAKALKEDPGNKYAEPPENSAIFTRQRNQPTKSPQRSIHIPRPVNLLMPPILGNVEEYYKDFIPQQNIPSPYQQQQQQAKREERRGSGSRPATLLDVRQSILEVRHSIHNSVPFTTTSSQRTSAILQNKSFPDANGKLLGSPRHSRPNSIISSSPRPISSYTNSTTNSRPTSFYKSEENYDGEIDSPTNYKPRSKKSKEIKISSSDDPESVYQPKSITSQPIILPEIKSVTSQSIMISLDKVVEENDSSDSESENNNNNDDDESSGDDIPLALKPTSKTPKIKVAPPPKINTKRSNNGGRVEIEAWLEHVSGSPESIGHSSRPSTPSQSPTLGHSPTHAYSPRIRKISEHSIKQNSPSSPLRMSHTPEPINDARNRDQPRRRSNSEFAPKKRNSIFYDQAPPQVPPFPPIGRASPSPRQDSGYWPKDTLLGLLDDPRHSNLMNDLNSISNPRRRSASFSNVSSSNSKIPPTNSNVAKVMNRHRREGSGSSSSHSSRPSTPQGNYLPQSYPLPLVPAVKSSKPKDSLSTPQMSSYLPSGNGNRNSLYMNNNNFNQRISSEQLKASHRNSVYLYQQKNRVRS